MASVGEKATAIAWDPRSPATLLLPSVGTGGNDERGRFQLNTLLSHDGVGCNTHETSALIELIDANDAYLASEDKSVRSLRSLSNLYRRALRECVQNWEDEMEADTKSDEMKSSSLEESLELLKLAYAVTHLSETFLLLPSSDSLMDYYENTANLPGAVTADTVRYLRLHHMPHPTDFAEESVIEELHKSLQPDQLDGGVTYWALVERYIVRGCLNDAWALLSRHSLLRRSLDHSAATLDDYQLAMLAEDREGFEALRALLWSAPLPAGRSDDYDAAFDDGEGSNENIDDTEYLEGVPPSAYQLWEASSTGSVSGDYPVSFQPHAATQMYDTWKQAVNRLPAITKLKRRIPQIQRVLDILSGNFEGVDFESWAEEFCAELLYKVPSLRLIDMNIRAARIMGKHDVATEGGFEEVVLSVMKGNAGRVIEVMHELGGGSGAALPAVMTSLICDILKDAGAMPMESTEYSLSVELLLNASFAIRSSLAAEGHHDLATRLAVRLLLPHVTVDGDVRVTATLVNTLEHHFPTSDAEANTLLSLCQPLVERKNVRILDACVSVALSRYRHFLRDQRPGGAVHWLLTGMETESILLCSEPSKGGDWQRALSTGVCYRLLVTYFMETSQSLLKGLLGDEEGVSLLYTSAKEMVSATEESDLAAFVPAIKVLEHIVIMAEAIVEQKEESIIASSVVACLEERSDDEDNGVMSSLSRSNMHWDLLRLAKEILDRSVQRDGLQNKQLYTSPFDVRGVQVLLERFTVIASSREMERFDTVSVEETQQMRLALGDGLMRAFVTENASKQKASAKVPKVSVAGICAADLGKHSRENQELVVESMLDF